MSLNDQEHLLNRLEGFPLIPCGAGTEGKAPVDPRTGQPLQRWQRQSFTPAQILSFNGAVKSVGTRCGPDAGNLLILDIDGQSAVEFLQKHEVNPDDVGWFIARTNCLDRYKVAFTIPPELEHHVKDFTGEVIGKEVLQTKAAVYDLDSTGKPRRDAKGRPIKVAKQEAIELFYGTGQCVVLGLHQPSGGQYEWIGDPTKLAPPSGGWLSVIKAVLQGSRSETTRLKPKKSGVCSQSGPDAPCVICGRNTSSACTTYEDGGRNRINCFEGQTFNPLDAHPTIKMGETVVGTDGIAYAFCGQGYNGSIGSFAKFAEHLEQKLPEVKFSFPSKEERKAAKQAETLDAPETVETPEAPEAEGQFDAEPTDHEADLELRKEALNRFQVAQQSKVELTEVFGHEWGQRLIERAAAFPCDPDMLLLPMLGYISSLVGTKVKVRVKLGWTEPLIIWGMIAQPASSLKSPAGAVIGKPLSKLQGYACNEHQTLKSVYDTKHKAWKSECTKLKKAATKDKAPAPTLPDEPTPPGPPRHYWVETVTIERLATMHSQSNVVGLLAFHDELADWFASLDKKGGQTDRPRWLKMWTGQALKHDTQTGVTAFAESTAVSVIGFIQPDKLASIIEAESKGSVDSSGDGLWSRFLPIIPKTIPFSYNELACDLTEDLLDLAKKLDCIGEDQHLYIANPAIAQVFKPAWEIWAAMETETGASRGAFLGKLRGYSVRIAGILHILHHGTMGEIDMVTANTAVKLCNFFLDQFDQLAPQVNAGEDVETPVAKFLQKVKDRGCESVTVRDLQRWKTLGKKSTSQEAREFLQSLANAEIGTFTQRTTKGSAKGSWEWRP